MTKRERFLALGLLVVVVLVGGGFFFYQFLFAPLRAREVTMRTLQEDLDRKAKRIQEVTADMPRLRRLRSLSLPADTDAARREYEKYLTGVLRESAFGAGNFSVVPKQMTDGKTSPVIPGKGPIYTRMTFTIIAHGNLKQLVTFLDRFYRTGLLHQIKTMKIQRPLTPGPQPDGLDITIAVEALSVAGAGNRPYLLPNLPPKLLVLDAITALCGAPPGMPIIGWAASPAGPLGPDVLAKPARKYAAIASKNIFLGELQDTSVRQEPIAVVRFVRLTDTSDNGKYKEAFLYNRTSNRNTRLRDQPGFDSFRIMDDKGAELVRGKVVLINPRDVIFRVESKFYKLHVGESIEEAMKKALSERELKAMGLAVTGEKVSQDK
jgi:hypothetical protein